MSKGRPAQPAEVKEAKGNPGRRPNPIAADSLATIPDQPPGELVDRAAEIWRELQPSLARNRILRQSDAPLFARYCLLLDWFWAAAKRVEEVGLVYETVSKHGRMDRQHPWFQSVLDLDKRLLNMERELGMTPVARSQLMQRLAVGGPLLPAAQVDEHGQSQMPFNATDPVGALRNAGKRTLN